jgi:hypothetical protein
MNRWAALPEVAFPNCILLVIFSPIGLGLHSIRLQARGLHMTLEQREQRFA